LPVGGVAVKCRRFWRIYDDFRRGGHGRISAVRYAFLLSR
jgi:hypothetical protein